MYHVIEAAIAGLFAGGALSYFFMAKIVAKTKAEAAAVGASVAVEAKKL